MTLLMNKVCNFKCSKGDFYVDEDARVEEVLQ